MTKKICMAVCPCVNKTAEMFKRRWKYKGIQSRRGHKNNTLVGIDQLDSRTQT